MKNESLVSVFVCILYVSLVEFFVLDFVNKPIFFKPCQLNLDSAATPNGTFVLSIMDFPVDMSTVARIDVTIEGTKHVTHLGTRGRRGSMKQTAFRRRFFDYFPKRIGWNSDVTMVR